ncbi:hypothetical protein [Massilia psychrophila]|uniref:hypothetical protein n=1 Tax=Massilia psychrophila TaxID=1603353 RepID=UPI0019ABA6A5|nr:hypothetical protein [Massilia psychrophila]GGE69318.1 hypothetical protein GCM10008020_12200 [Massilia psychrophila]
MSKGIEGNAGQIAEKHIGQNGLATVPQIEALADQLSVCADQIHARVMKDIKAYNGKPVGDAEQATARALLDDELLLRQRANSLYADAATYVVKTLGKPQQHVMELTTAAAEKIRKIKMIGDVVGLVGGLLSLAGAAATGQPVPILAALDKIRLQVKTVEATMPKKPPLTPA